MTREERLDWLCRLRSEIYVFMPKEWLKPMDEALTDSIKALEQEPTTKNDLPHCQHTDAEIAKSFIEDVEAVKDYLPSVNPQEPKTGHWLWCGSSHKCSNCEEYTCFSDKNIPKYCPNCGARMSEVEQ